MKPGSRGHHVLRSVETQSISETLQSAGSRGDSAGTEIDESPHLNSFWFSSIAGFAGTCGDFRRVGAYTRMRGSRDVRNALCEYSRMRERGKSPRKSPANRCKYLHHMRLTCGDSPK